MQVGFNQLLTLNAAIHITVVNKLRHLKIRVRNAPGLALLEHAGTVVRALRQQLLGILLLSLHLLCGLGLRVLGRLAHVRLFVLLRSWDDAGMSAT